jgi:hypothetical protein
MRFGTLGAACALCAAAVPASAAGQSPADAGVSAAPAAPAPPDPPVAPPPPALAPAEALAPGDMQRAGLRQLLDRHIELSHRYERLSGDRLSRVERREIRNTVGKLAPLRVRAETRELRVDIRRLRRRLERKYGGAPDVAIPPVLKSIAQCEFARRSARDLLRRHLSRQVSVLLRDVGRSRRQGRSRRGVRDRAGSPRGDPLPQRRPGPLARLRALTAQLARRVRRPVAGPGAASWLSRGWPACRRWTF